MQVWHVWTKMVKAQPELAKSVDVSKDGLTYTFHLRDGLKWSNGDALTAKDFVYSWQRAVDPATASEYGYLLGPVKMPTKSMQVKLINQHLVLKQPMIQHLLSHLHNQHLTLNSWQLTLFISHSTKKLLKNTENNTEHHQKRWFTQDLINLKIKRLERFKPNILNREEWWLLG